MASSISITSDYSFHLRFTGPFTTTSKVIVLRLVTALSQIRGFYTVHTVGRKQKQTHTPKPPLTRSRTPCAGFLEACWKLPTLKYPYGFRRFLEVSDKVSVLLGALRPLRAVEQRRHDDHLRFGFGLGSGSGLGLRLGLGLGLVRVGVGKGRE